MKTDKKELEELKAAIEPLMKLIKQVQVPTVQKTVEVPQIQYIDKIVDAPVAVTQQFVQVADDAEVQGPKDELVPVAPNMGAGGSHPQATMMPNQEWTEELREIRQIVEFLVRRERKLDVKADVAIWRLKRKTSSGRAKRSKPAFRKPSQTRPRSSSSLSTSGSSTRASALARLPQARSSSSTPALSKVPRSS